jgi:hypothetical protein
MQNKTPALTAGVELRAPEAISREHDPKSGNRFSEKIMLKQEAKA